MAPLTNTDALKARLGRHVANQIEFRVQELCKMAESFCLHIQIDYKPRKAASVETVTVIVKHDPEQEPELKL